MSTLKAVMLATLVDAIEKPRVVHISYSLSFYLDRSVFKQVPSANILHFPKKMMEIVAVRRTVLFKIITITMILYRLIKKTYIKYNRHDAYKLEIYRGRPQRTILILSSSYTPVNNKGAYNIVRNS